MTAPLVANVKAADSRNASVAKRASLWFLPAGLTGEANWREFGTVINPAFAPQISTLEHNSNRRGGKTRDRIEISQVKADMKFKIDEINQPNVQKALGSSAAKSVSTAVARDSQIFTNPGNAGVITLPAGALSTIIVRSTNEEGAQTTYVAGGTDYTPDLTAGTVTITGGALTSAVTVPEIDIQWAKTVNTEKGQIFDGIPIRGSAQFQILTKNGARIIVTLFNVVLSNDGDVTFGDGSAWIELGLKMECLADSSGSLGEIHFIGAAETF